MTLSKNDHPFYLRFENLKQAINKAGDALGIYSNDQFFQFNLLRLCRREVLKSNTSKNELKKSVHTHNVFHLVMVIDGSGKIIHKGKFLDINKNEIICINPGEPHCLKCITNDLLRVIILTFELKTKTQVEYNLNLSNYFQHLFASKAMDMTESVYQTQLLKFKGLVEICEEVLKGIVENPSEKISSHYQTKLMSFFSDLNEIIGNKKIMSKSQKAPYFMQKYIEYIEKNYQRDISIQELADEVKLSKAYFQRSFKKYSGTTAIELLKLYRVSRAKLLLIHTENKLSIISIKCGFKNEYYFSKVFKDCSGVSPGIYRKKNTID